MPEIYPRITYSPEGFLELHKDFAEETSQEHVDRIFEPVAASDDYVLSQRDGEYVVQTHIPSLLPAKDYDPLETQQRLGKAIKDLSAFTFADPFDMRDYVFDLEFWSQHGARGVVYPHMQRWLNADLLDEDIGRQVFDAMLLPFHPDIQEVLRKEFEYRAYGREVSSGVGGLSVNFWLRVGRFDVTRLVEVDGEPKYQTGTVDWHWPNLSTIGSCACWGVDGMDRSDVYLHPDMARLYEMQPHNIDGPLQSLSLVLGMGRLAYEAANYDGEEDILAGVEWAD